MLVRSVTPRWRLAATIGAALVVGALSGLRGWAEPDWRLPRLDELQVREDKGAAQEASFYKRFYRALRIESHDRDGARAIYRELLAERPKCAYLYFKLGMLDYPLQIESCIKNLKTALQLDPTLATVYDRLGYIFSARDRDDDLIALLEQAIQHVKPDNIKYYLALGELYEKHDQTDKAEDVYRRAIAEHPVLFAPWLKLFALQLNAGRGDEAYATFQKALDATGGHRSLLVGVRDLYAEHGDKDRVFGLDELLVERFPSRSDFWLDYLGQLLDRGETAKARAAFEKSCAYVATGDPDYVLKVIGLYAAYGNADEAIAVFERALEWQPELPELLVALAVLYEQQGETDKAQALEQRLLALNPSSTLLVAIAQSYEQRGDVEAFGKWARRAVEADPKSLDARIALLRYTEQAGRTDEAKALLAEMLGGEPADPQACAKLAEHYLDRKEYQRVRDIAAKGLDATRNPPLVRQLYYLSGMADFYEQRIPDAAMKLKVSAKRGSEISEATYYLGVCYQRLGRAKDAVKMLERAVVETPWNPAIRVRLAQALRAAGEADAAQKQFDAVVKAFEMIVSQTPESVEARLDFAGVLSQIGRTDEAEREYKKALELDPKSAVALNNLAYMWAEKGTHLDEALEMVRKALEIEPDSGVYIDSLGWVYYQQGHYADALRELDRAVRLEPPNAEIYDHVGDTQLKLGDQTKAIEWWNKALGLYPEDAAPIRQKIVEHGGKPAVE
jgi:tetratricopeptide (TPR) repeat protein